MPECDNVEEYWKLLLEGRCGVRDMPEARFQKGREQQGLTAEYKKVLQKRLSLIDEKS
jgi:acyl transferase domain-containing protein